MVFTAHPRNHVHDLRVVIVAFISIQNSYKANEVAKTDFG